MTRITCNCDQCQSNATHLGLTAPLGVDLPDTAARLLAGKNGKIPAKVAHSTVWTAYDPTLGTTVCARYGWQRVNA